MKKIKKKYNILIKKKNLILELNKKGIRNISKDSLNILERHLEDYLQNLSEILKEEMIVSGRKTLKKEDVEKALSEIHEKEEFWEV